jgi:hypothetical protein
MGCVYILGRSTSTENGKDDSQVGGCSFLFWRYRTFPPHSYTFYIHTHINRPPGEVTTTTARSFPPYTHARGPVYRVSRSSPRPTALCICAVMLCTLSLFPCAVRPGVLASWHPFSSHGGLHHRKRERVLLHWAAGRHVVLTVTEKRGGDVRGFVS